MGCFCYFFWGLFSEQKNAEGKQTGPSLSEQSKFRTNKVSVFEEREGEREREGEGGGGAQKMRWVDIKLQWASLLPLFQG